MIKSKPWWLRRFVSDDMSVTLSPHIYLSDVVYANQAGYLPIIEHEKLHLKQQAGLGLLRWMYRYATNKAFVLDQETRAYGLGLTFYSAEYRDEELAYAANALIGDSYRHAAPNAETAIRLILEAYTLAGGLPWCSR